MNTSNQIFSFVLSFLLSASGLTLTSTSTTVNLQCLTKGSAGTGQDEVSHTGFARAPLASSCMLLYRGRFSWYSAHVRCHMQGLALADLSKYPFTQIELGSDDWLTNGPSLPRRGLEHGEQATECYMTSSRIKSAVDCSEQKDEVRFACAPINANFPGMTSAPGEQGAIGSESNSHMHTDANNRGNDLSCPTTWTMMKLDDQVLSSCIKEVRVANSSNSTDPLTWIQTQQMCAKEGGHLFWSKDDLESQWFLNYLKQLREN